MNKVELMAPAGNKEAFLGAINAGANAVYLAGKKFGARAFASNFESTEMADLVRYAHLRGAKVYITLNTLIFDDEVEELLRYADELVRADVDALIVQDLGMLDLLHRRYPQMPIHASTQTNAHNVDQVRFLKELGASRVILARETSIDVIREIKKAVDIEIEVFVHGALCVCYSGNCLFSSMVGHRSGNRGECGQLCRLPYTLMKDGEPVSEEAYLMSTKDLMTLPRLHELMDAGIDAFKIEGRMRKPDYVIQSVLSYRNVMEAEYQKKDVDLEAEIDRLKRVFNREYTEGYVLNAKPHTLNNPFRPNHMGVEIGVVESFVKGKVTFRLTGDLSVNDGVRFVGEVDSGDVVSRILTESGLVVHAHAGEVISLDSAEPVVAGSTVLKTLDHELVKSLETYLEPDRKLIPVHGIARVFVGKTMSLTIRDENGNEAEVSLEDYVVLPAQKAPATRETIENQLIKLGNTPFYWGSLEVETDGLGFVPVKILNELRRIAIEKITELRTRAGKESVIVPETPSTYRGSREPFELIAKIRTKDQLEACCQAGLKTLYYEDSMDLNPGDHPDIHFYKQKRRIWPDSAVFKIEEDSVVNEVGSLYHFQGHTLVGDTFLNVTNVYTAKLLLSKGLKSLTLSPELQKDRISIFYNLFTAKFGGVANLEIVGYGRTELMLSKYCPIAKTTGVNKTHCHLCEANQYSLKDRMGYEFALVNDGDCNIRLLNPKPLCLVDHVQFLMDSGLSKIRLDFTVETAEETVEILEAFQRAVRKESFSLNRRNMTYGRFQR